MPADAVPIPARLICHALADAMQGHAERLLTFDRRTKDSTRAGRTALAERTRRMAHAVATFGASLPHGSCVDAALAGLLIALALGHGNALADLEDRLLEMGLDAAVERLDAVAGDDVPGVVRAVMEE